MKWFWGILSFIILIILICVILLFTNSAFLFNRALSWQLGMKVRIENASIGSEEIRMDQFKIMNPRGFKGASALTVGLLQIDAPLKSYLSKVITIEQVVARDITLRFESNSKNGTTSNWKILTKKTESQSEVDSQNPLEDGSDERYAYIKVLKLQNIMVEVISDGKVRSRHRIADITLTNIRTDRDNVVRRIILIIMNRTLRKAHKHLESGLKWQRKLQNLNKTNFPFPF